MEKSDTDCRWPLVFRFIKGAIHVEILLPVFLHAMFTAFVVYLDTYGIRYRRHSLQHRRLFLTRFEVLN
jgi:hypothetical protein